MKREVVAESDRTATDCDVPRETSAPRQQRGLSIGIGSLEHDDTTTVEHRETEILSDADAAPLLDLGRRFAQHDTAARSNQTRRDRQRLLGWSERARHDGIERVRNLRDESFRLDTPDLDVLHRDPTARQLETIGAMPPAIDEHHVEIRPLDSDDQSWDSGTRTQVHHTALDCIERPDEGLGVIDDPVHGPGPQVTTGSRGLEDVGKTLASRRQLIQALVITCDIVGATIDGTVQAAIGNVVRAAIGDIVAGHGFRRGTPRCSGWGRRPPTGS